MSNRVVYTALLGGYEGLNDAQPNHEGIDFVCFTDDPGLTSARWQIVVVDPAFPLDPHRSQRRLKILGDPHLDQYTESLYIDNTVSLRGEIGEFFDYMFADADMGMVRHSYHKQLSEEFAAVWSAGLDDYHRLTEQWDHYSALYPAALSRDALWGGIIARRNTPEVRALCLAWYEHVLRYSRRDQLSAPVAVSQHPYVRFASRDIDNFGSAWHTWPVALERNQSMRDGASTVKARRDLSALVAEYDRATDMEQQLRVVSEQNGALTQTIAELRSSSSWRITAPLRALRRN